MVIRREYLERVRKKSFWIGTLVFPLFMGFLVFGQFALMMLNPEEQKKIALVDESGAITKVFSEALAKKKLKDGRPEYPVEAVPVAGSLEETRRSLEPRVSAKELFGILTVANDPDAKEALRLYGRSVGNVRATEDIEDALHDAIVGNRLAGSHLAVDREALDKIMAPVEVETFQLQAGGEAQKKGFMQAYFSTFIFVLILYMTLLLYGIAVMRGILEEKSNRVMEVLLGPLTPTELMIGKILGIGLVGLTQVMIYVVVGSAFRVVAIQKGLGGDLSAVLDSFSPLTLAYFVLFFLLGYFLFVALFAAIGAVCNTEQEAQNLQGGVSMCLVIPMISTFFFINHPDSTLAVVASLIPIFTPMLMYMRISVLTPPFWQIALSVVLTGLTIWVLMRGVAKIFRIGILMYGKKPTVPEILRWARTRS